MHHFLSQGYPAKKIYQFDDLCWTSEHKWSIILWDTFESYNIEIQFLKLRKVIVFGIFKIKKQKEQ